MLKLIFDFAKGYYGFLSGLCTATIAAGGIHYYRYDAQPLSSQQIYEQSLRDVNAATDIRLRAGGELENSAAGAFVQQAVYDDSSKASFYKKSNSKTNIIFPIKLKNNANLSTEAHVLVQSSTN